MKKLLMISVSAVAIATAAPALSADLAAKAPAPVPYFTWTGLYVGAHVGWGQDKFDNTQGFLPSGVPTSFMTGLSATSGGTMFGGQLGYNLQVSPAFVLGIEADISGLAMNGFSYAHPYSNCCFAWFKSDALTSVTGRIGYTGWDPRTMFYVKGGGAWVRDKSMFSYALNSTQDRAGWTVGAGIEWAPAMLTNWSLFAEYDHYGFGTKNMSECFTATCSAVAVRQNINSVKLGANYKFNLGH